MAARAEGGGGRGDAGGRKSPRDGGGGGRRERGKSRDGRGTIHGTTGAARGDNRGEIDDRDGGKQVEKNDRGPAGEYTRQRRRGEVLRGR